MEPSCCVVYTTDLGYLVPTLVSAIQARNNISETLADIVIFGIGIPEDAADVFASVCEAERVKFISLRADQFETSNAMLARLFVARFAPAVYRDFLYIDGDTQITGSLDPLVSAVVPPGCFMAVNDPMTFELPLDGRVNAEWARYFQSIGISLKDANNYFNTGMIRINRDGWDDIGQAAWMKYQQLRDASRFPDQDALNIVAGGQRIPVSLAWNFPIFLKNARIESHILPRVYHYMGSPKPWHGSFAPWNVAVHQPYIALIQRYPALARLLTEMTKLRKFRYFFQQYYKCGVESVSWGLSAKRGRILDYERQQAGRGLAVGSFAEAGYESSGYETSEYETS